jgi:alpha-L-arabinofuranosidase
MIILALPLSLAAQPKITVQVDQPGVKISPTMYGVFFEDINFGADGGLYPELVKNRSFEFDKPLRGWRLLRKSPEQGTILILRNEEKPRNPRYVRLTVHQASDGFGLSNEGFRGMGIRAGETYRFSLDARKVDGDIMALRAQVVDGEGNTLAEGRLTSFTDDWQKHEIALTASATEVKAKLNIWVEGTGTLDLDMISLFPKNTWKGRKNGLRPDLVQLLADLKPGFLRFPGGCIVEGFNLEQRYKWKDTVGPLNQRVLNINRWNFEFKHRPTPDYFQSYGLGYFEYFQLAEDLGAEPMPILSCGMACQFNTAELVPMDQLDPYIQDALDLIEFANGPTKSRWGKVRADMGHPEPFDMKFLGVGNEQWGPQYVERYKVFAKAIKDKYPEIRLIAATGSDPSIFPNGEAEVDYLWQQWRTLKPDIVDEHFYRKADWFVENANRFDAYPRDGIEVFVGEYAAQSVGVASPDNRNTWKCALYEAAFMTGLERNADQVTMSCYAPLFGHEEAWQWRPNLIWFDNLQSYGTANYYVQKLFSLNRGDRQLIATVEHAPAIDDKKQGLHASATLDKKSGEVIIKVVNITDAELRANVVLHGVGQVGTPAKVILLRSDSLDDENSLQEPKKIYPQESTATFSTPNFTYDFQSLSLTVLRVPVE